MNSTSKHSHVGFICAMIEFGLILVLIILSSLLNSQSTDVISNLIGFIVIITGFVSIVGLVKSLIGLKEPNTVKKIIGISINLSVLILFTYMIVSNVMDIYKAFSQ